MLRLLAAAFACASLVYAVDSDDQVRRTLRVSAATRLTMNAEFGSINVQTGGGRSVEVEAYFRGTPPSRDEFDRMRNVSLAEPQSHEEEAYGQAGDRRQRDQYSSARHNQALGNLHHDHP